MEDIPDYGWNSATFWTRYLWPSIEGIIKGRNVQTACDVGCGNGSLSNALAALGIAVTGIDPSEKGIEIAKRTFPHVRFFQGNGSEDLAAQYGQFDLVVCSEVIEHCYDPAKIVGTIFDLLVPGGLAIITTPYHGYIKNIAIAVSGKWDAHHMPLLAGGGVDPIRPDTQRIAIV
jgi:2-polyprenyl-3-methyl-5-hydroxy-6-metoxy-1,4-benzoquinol methylase